MKSRRFKHAMWGATIFVVIHSVFVGHCIKEGGEALMGIAAIDYPLYLFGEVFIVVFPKVYNAIFYSSSTLFYIYFIGLGTLMYALFGSLIGIIIYKIDKFCEKIR